MKTEELEIKEHRYTVCSGWPSGGKTSVLKWEGADDSWRGKLRTRIVVSLIGLKWWWKRKTRKSPNDKAEAQCPGEKGNNATKPN